MGQGPSQRWADPRRLQSRLEREKVVIIPSLFPEAMGRPEAAFWRTTTAATSTKRPADQDTE